MKQPYKYFLTLIKAGIVFVAFAEVRDVKSASWAGTAARARYSSWKPGSKVVFFPYQTEQAAAVMSWRVYTLTQAAGAVPGTKT